MEEQGTVTCVYEMGEKIERATMYFNKEELEIMEMCLRNQESLEFADVLKDIHSHWPDADVKWALEKVRGKRTDDLEELVTSLINQGKLEKEKAEEEIRAAIDSESLKRYKIISRIRDTVERVIKQLTC